MQEQMAAFAVNETSSDTTVLIATHIQTCARCQAWHQEVLDMLGIWMQDEPEPGLDLVPRVMQRIEGLAANTSATTFLNKSITRRLRMSQRTVWFHYGIAASLAFALFHFGVFEQLGWGISQTTALLSQKMQGIAEQVSSF